MTKETKPAPLHPSVKQNQQAGHGPLAKAPPKKEHCADDAQKYPSETK